MSKKWMLIAGISLLVVAIAAGLLLIPRKGPAKVGTSVSSGSTTSSSTSTTSSSAAGTGAVTTQGQAGTGAGTTPGQAGTGAGTTGANSAGKVAGTSPALAPLKPFTRMPEPTIPAETLKSPAAPGKALAPLTAAPDPTISGVALGTVPDGSQYLITMRPYGIGPSIVLGSRIVIRVDSAKPVGTAPAYGDFSNANLLVVVDTDKGGAVTKGGTYTATMVMRSDGAKLLPIMSEAKATQ